MCVVPDKSCGLGTVPDTLQTIPHKMFCPGKKNKLKKACWAVDNRVLLENTGKSGNKKDDLLGTPTTSEGSVFSI